MIDQGVMTSRDFRRDRALMASLWPKVPAPATLSEAARALWASGLPMPEASSVSLAEQRAVCDAIQHDVGARRNLPHGVRIEAGEIAGVPVRFFHPVAGAASDRLLVNCHGGAFMKDSGSITENVTIAALTGATVIAILYRLVPEYRFPAAVDDVEAVYRSLLASRSPASMSLYGTSAGATLSAQALVRMRQHALPFPARLGFFSGTADLARPTDSEFFFPLADDPDWMEAMLRDYLGSETPTSPAVSPLLGDISDFPPTLCIASTRDLMLSPTALFHRALLNADVPAEMIVFEALPHAFWSYLDLPETDEAFSLMARFLGGDAGQ